MKWVSSAAGAMHGNIHGVMPAPNSTGPAGSHEDRQAIFDRLRDPNTPPDISISKQDMPKIWSDYYPKAVTEALKKIQYQTLQRWRDWLDDNDIHNDWVGHPVPETQITPDGLTRATLESLRRRCLLSRDRNQTL